MNFFTSMLKCKSKIYEKRSRLSAEAYKKVQKFVEDGNYSSCKRANDIAKLIFKGYDEFTMAEMFGISIETLRCQKKSISRELWGIFPEDFFEKLVDFNDNRTYLEGILKYLDCVDILSKDVVLSDVVRCIKTSSNILNTEDYELNELIDEIDFLLRYSYLFLSEDLKNVDINKLNYLIKVLDGTDLGKKSKILERLGVLNDFSV